MKTRYVMLVICLLFFANPVHADEKETLWKAAIYANGQDMGGMKYQEVMIGIDKEGKTVPAPPSPPAYSVSLNLVDPEGNLAATDVRKNGEDSYMWIIAVNPHGNIMPPGDRTSIISWFPFELGHGNFELRKGYGGTGEAVIPDMKSVSSLEVSGGAKPQYFTVVFIPEKF